MKQFPTCGLLIKISVVVGLNRQFFNPGEGKNTPSNQIPKSSKVSGEKIWPVQTCQFGISNFISIAHL